MKISGIFELLFKFSMRLIFSVIMKKKQIKFQVLLLGYKNFLGLRSSYMLKQFHTPTYNMLFDTKDGSLLRWGKTLEDDPLFCPIGPEIVDVELSTICHQQCEHCYKSNSSIGKNMSLEAFKVILSKLPKQVVTQIAFGIGSIDANPDLMAIMQHTREQGVIPNITVNGVGITDEWAAKLASVCGAVSVSHYSDDNCFNTVERLSNAGIKQVNIHALNSLETFETNMRLLGQVKTDPRLKGLKAVVFLQLKPKGERNIYNPASLKQMKALLDEAERLGVAIGMDSCSAPLALKILPATTHQSIEPCESFGLFSAYINVDGKYFPCSFAEGVGEWEEGLDVVNCKDFTEDIWYNPKVNKWRDISLELTQKCNCSHKKICRVCPLFDITPCYHNVFIEGCESKGESIACLKNIESVNPVEKV
jgi:MoaA/NifB/PqqE/SkfB family radical SAM enzyme